MTTYRDALAALLDAIDGQNLYHGRYGTTPAGHATAMAILAGLRERGWMLVPHDTDALAALLHEADCKSNRLYCDGQRCEDIADRLRGMAL